MSSAANRSNYFPKTFFTSPILFRTVPLTLSAVPRSCRSRFPVARPAFSFTAPLACSTRPLILSLVLDFMPSIRGRASFGTRLLAKGENPKSEARNSKQFRKHRKRNDRNAEVFGFELFVL